MTTCNTTLIDLGYSEQLLWGGDPTLHLLLAALGGGLTLVAIIFSLQSLIQHANHYLKPWQQRQ